MHAFISLVSILFRKQTIKKRTTSKYTWSTVVRSTQSPSPLVFPKDNSNNSQDDALTLVVHLVEQTNQQTNKQSINARSSSPPLTMLFRQAASIFAVVAAMTPDDVRPQHQDLLQKNQGRLDNHSLLSTSSVSQPSQMSIKTKNTTAVLSSHSVLVNHHHDSYFNNKNEANKDDYHHHPEDPDVGILAMATHPQSYLPVSSSVKDHPMDSDLGRQLQTCPYSTQCTGGDACYSYCGPVGNGSCNGLLACLTSFGSVGDCSCNGNRACIDIRAPIGNGSCNGYKACYFIGNDGSNACGPTSNPVGAGSCNGNQACSQSSNPVGAGSCNGNEACTQTSDPIGAGSCNGNVACYALNDVTIGNNSCNCQNCCRFVDPGSCIGDGQCNDSMNPCSGVLDLCPTPAPVAPTPAPVAPTPAPVAPTPAPVTSPGDDDDDEGKKGKGSIKFKMMRPKSKNGKRLADATNPGDDDDYRGGKKQQQGKRLADATVGGAAGRASRNTDYRRLRFRGA
jgi:hypothetical protein